LSSEFIHTSSQSTADDRNSRDVDCNNRDFRMDFVYAIECISRFDIIRRWAIPSGSF